MVAACAPQAPPADVTTASDAADPESEFIQESSQPESEVVEAPTAEIVDVTVDENGVVESAEDRNDDVNEQALETYTSTFANRADPSKYEDLEIITLLPQDAIPAINNPIFHQPEEANEFYEPDELVIGVVFNGDARAYSIPHLSSHEIVNDEVGGVKISVTW